MSNIIYIIIGAVILCAAIFFIIRKRKNSFHDAKQHPENEQLYVGNLSYHVNTHQLKHIFSQYGDVQYARLIKNPHTGRSKGFAFITYTNIKDAKKALSLNGEVLRGRPIVVRMAKPKRI